MSDIFTTAADTRKNAYSFRIVHTEARDIEDAILSAAQIGVLDTIVSGTTMTSALNSSFAAITGLDTATNIISYPSHGFLTGEQVQFNNPDVYPSPISPNTTYYVIKTDNNNFKIAANYNDAVAGTAIDITTDGSGGTQVRRIETGQQYFNVWKGLNEDRAKLDQMNSVINYFQSLGYVIIRKTNVSTGNTFVWAVSW